jgi:glycerophosphoryl diester phosphodiesterase
MSIASILLTCGLSLAGGAVDQGDEPGPLPDRPTSIHEFLALDYRPAVVAHRGLSAHRPENTLAAVRAAIAVGADVVEVDVTLTVDGHVVVIHDETVDRTTNAAGPVSEYTLAELQRLDAGSWFSPEWANERIPTLAQVLDTTNGKILLNIEIKSEAVGSRVEGGIVEKVVRLVNDRGMTDQVVVSSFEPRALVQTRAVDPHIVTASLFNKNIHHGMDPVDVVDAAGSKALVMSRKRITARIVERCRTLGIPVGVYTVNEERLMRRMIRMQVHALFTDDAELLMRVIRDEVISSPLDALHPPVGDVPQRPDGGDSQMVTSFCRDHGPEHDHQHGHVKYGVPLPEHDSGWRSRRPNARGGQKKVF